MRQAACISQVLRGTGDPPFDEADVIRRGPHVGIGD
jgi:hypothetical protein